jgi:hypothetical protein
MLKMSLWKSIVSWLAPEVDPIAYPTLPWPARLAIERKTTRMSLSSSRIQSDSSTSYLELRLPCGTQQSSTRRAGRCALLKTSGLTVEVGTGGQTKFNRSQLGLPKAHLVDAACVGESGSTVKVDAGLKALSIKACGHGSRQMCGTDEYGFPIMHRTRQKLYFGFRDGRHRTSTCTRTQTPRPLCGTAVVSGQWEFRHRH